MLAGQSNVNGLEDGYLVKTGMDMLLWLSLPDTGFVENDSLVYALDYFRSYTSPRVGIDSLLQFTVRDVEHVHGEIEDGWLTITADPDWFGSDSLLLTVTEVANEDNNASTYLRTTVREYEDVTEPLLSNSPKQFKLLNPYPNPFNSSTTIQYQLPESSQVDMQIVDIQGRRIVDLVKGRINAGYHTAVWDGSNAPSGIYYCWIKTDDNSQCVKLVLLR